LVSLACCSTALCDKSYSSVQLLPNNKVCGVHLRRDRLPRVASRIGRRTRTRDDSRSSSGPSFRPFLPRDGKRREASVDLRGLAAMKHYTLPARAHVENTYGLSNNDYRSQSTRRATRDTQSELSLLLLIILCRTLSLSLSLSLSLAVAHLKIVKLKNPWSSMYTIVIPICLISYLAYTEKTRRRTTRYCDAPQLRSTDYVIQLEEIARERGSSTDISSIVSAIFGNGDNNNAISSRNRLPAALPRPSQYSVGPRRARVCIYIYIYIYIYILSINICFPTRALDARSIASRKHRDVTLVSHEDHPSRRRKSARSHRMDNRMGEEGNSNQSMCRTSAPPLTLSIAY